MKSFIGCLFVIGCVFVTGSLYGQSATGEVLGTVVDASKAPVSKATVTLLNQDTGIAAKTTTTDAGNYDFFNVQVGIYTVTAEATGLLENLKRKMYESMSARANASMRNLTVGSASQSVEVSGAAAVLDTDSSEHSQLINTAQIVELPLNGPQLCGSCAALYQRHALPHQHSRRQYSHPPGSRFQYQRHA